MSFKTPRPRLLEVHTLGGSLAPTSVKSLRQAITRRLPDVTVKEDAPLEIGDRQMRPDLVVEFPDGRNVVVEVKSALALRSPGVARSVGALAEQVESTGYGFVVVSTDDIDGNLDAAVDEIRQAADRTRQRRVGTVPDARRHLYRGGR